MTKLPPLRVREVVRAFRRLGFEQVRQQGSHAIFHHQDCRRAPLPIHPTAEVSPYFLADIPKEIGVSEDEFLTALKRRRN
ncbi:MAG: type II toxin-antitoxin system HicA family toxin [Chloroflexi bacterium]|nr:type II toxin-antitoxin system HicA family toxin [Chloroflexota bacterium]